MSTPHPLPPPSDFPAKTTRTNQKEDRKNVVVAYKTKEIKYRNQKKLIVLQNENGPCPLIAICNVLLLSNRMDLHPDRFQVTQERLLNLVADILFDIDDDEEEDLEEKLDAINLLPRLAHGINVDIKFRSIDDFERTPELAIFELLKIPLYHGWIFDPQDYETATAIGCKSYNDLMTGLVTLAETQTVKGQGCGECSVDFSAALVTPSQPCSKTRSFAGSTPTRSAEHGRLARGDIEEEIALLRALRLSERENLGFELVDTRRDSSSGGKSASGYSDVYWMSEGDSLVDSMDTASGSTSTPGSGNICPKSRCDDQFSSKGSEYSTDCDAGNKIDVGEEICSPASSKMTSEALHHDHAPLYEDDKCVTVGSPVCEGESTPGQISPEGKDTNRLTPEDGEVVKSFLNNNASQLTFLGLFFLQEGLKEGELCVFFRNNHFYTMLKKDKALYNLVTDQGYLTERDLVWENLNEVNGDSVFVTGDFKVFEFESGNWDQEDVVSNTADYIYSINSLSKEGMEIDPDLKMAMELQEQELGEDIVFEVSIREAITCIYLQYKKWKQFKDGKCTCHVYKLCKV